MLSTLNDSLLAILFGFSLHRYIATFGNTSSGRERLRKKDYMRISIVDAW